MRAAAVLPLILFAASVVAADKIPPEVMQGRNLTSYDDGGVYRTPVNKERVTDLERLRQFVWTHWTKKHRGYVEVVFQGTDSGTQAYLFIEPVDGQWRIVWRDFYYSIISESPVPPHRYRDIVTVERCRGSLIFFDADNQIVRYL